MIASRLADLPEYAFPRLRALLAPHPMGGGAEVAMSIGEPRHPFPAWAAALLVEAPQSYAKYPPIDGTPDWREAVTGWIQGRFGAALDPDREVLPVSGTREALFMAAQALVDPETNGRRTAVLLPNPFYQCYAAAALNAGAEPVFVPATEETGWLPDFASVSKDVLDRTGFAFWCSPSNPQGAVADEARIAGVLELAERHGFTVCFDEPYSEIWRDAPPPGALGVVRGGGFDSERALVMNSLSKRSSAAGLRSGFVAGGPRTIEAVKRLRAYAGAPSPLPVLAAAAALWRDEAHVDESRALYQAKYALADEVLGGLPGYHPPEAGFFLWLGVEDGEAATVRLWREAGVKVLPGAYLGRGDPRFLGGANPGTRFVRAALVEPVDAIRPGLEAIAALLGEGDRP